MERPATTVLLMAVAGLLLSSGAAAANRNAQKMVAGVTKEHATLLTKFPALGLIDNVIRFDCAAKNQGKLATDEFCGCASAITMNLWRSGVDPNMMPRLTEFLRNPTDAGAAEFARYQGPELYGPICTEADKG